MAPHQGILQVDIEAIIEAAQAAADLVLQMQRDGLRQLQNKSSAIDIVTEADLASEKLLRTFSRVAAASQLLGRGEQPATARTAFLAGGPH